MNVRKTRTRMLILAATATAVLTTLVICVGIGTVRFSLAEILRALFVNDDSTARLIIMELRLPRVLCCMLVGVCLSLSGCILQGVMRNTLASPSTVGTTSGAAFVGYLTLAVFPSYAPLLPIGAIIGAFVTTLFIYLLAYRKGVTPTRIILAGVAVSALFGAFNDMIRTMFADSLGNASGFLVGGFNGCGTDSLLLILPYAIAGILVCALLPSKMNILLLGDETAASLGVNVELLRFILIAISSLLAGSAVAVAGLISFVGLIVPHIARLIIGSDYRFLFPLSALLGALLLSVCDTLGRVIMPLGEIPAGIIIAILGSPFFLWLLRVGERGER